MRMRCLVLSFGVLFFASPCGASGALEGLWAYESSQRPGEEAISLTGLFLFHEGRFAHQVVHDGEPLEAQIAEAHLGTYELSGDALHLEVSLGTVIQPGREPLLSGRSNTSHRVTAVLSDPDRLVLTFANGARERLRRLPGDPTELIRLESGMLALAGEHFLFVASPGADWIFGSGTYRREGASLHLRAQSWVEVENEKVSYARDRALAARLENDALRLPATRSFRLRPPGIW